jgi:hypothetical protein
MEQTIKTTAKQDAEARQLLYSKSPEEKEQVKAAKAAWKRNNPNQK